MRLRLQFRWIGILGLVLAATLYVFAQQPAGSTATPTRQESPRPAQVGRRGARVRGASRTAPFPKRPPAPPAEVAHGKQIFESNCSFCHGPDATGGEGGPNLLISQPVLDDQHGEHIAPIVHGGLPGGMPKFNLSMRDITGIAAWLHSLPIGDERGFTSLDILVGNAQAGKTYFDQHCTTCHSATGDLAGIGSKYSPVELQNMIVSGRAGRGFGRGGPAANSRVTPQVTVTLPTGEVVKGSLVHMTAFVVALRQPDGTYRSFSRHGAIPKVEVKNPLQWHVDMLPKWNDTDIHNLTAYLVTLK